MNIVDKLIEKGKEIFNHSDSSTVQSDVIKGSESVDVVKEGTVTTASGEEVKHVVVKPTDIKSLPHEREKETAPLTFKEMKALKKSNYEKIEEEKKFKTTFVLKNKKTNQVAEIRAASSFHACSLIGWRPNKVIVLKEKQD